MDDLSSPNAQNLHIYMNRYVFKGGLFLSDKKLTEDKFDNHRLTKFLPFISPNPVTSFNPVQRYPKIMLLSQTVYELHRIGSFLQVPT